MSLTPIESNNSLRKGSSWATHSRPKIPFFNIQDELSGRDAFERAIGPVAKVWREFQRST